MKNLIFHISYLLKILSFFLLFHLIDADNQCCFTLYQPTFNLHYHHKYFYISFTNYKSISIKIKVWCDANNL